MRPRRSQTPISIRSDKVAARLKVLTRNGRSQVEILEEAIDLFPVEEDAVAARIARIKALIERISTRERRFVSMAEFDEWAYDERGLPR